MSALVLGEVMPAVSLIGNVGQLVIDEQGRRWCMVGARRGFRRAACGWVYGDRVTDVVEPVRAFDTVTALEAWEAAHVPADSDPTPAHGMVRPLLAGWSWR